VNQTPIDVGRLPSKRPPRSYAVDWSPPGSTVPSSGNTARLLPGAARFGEPVSCTWLTNTILFLLVFGGVSLHLLSGSHWQTWFQPLFAEPWKALFRGLLLLYRPEYLDILPMYVLFLVFVTPALAGIQAGHGWAVMGLSALMWLWIQVLPPPESHSLNPLGYQVLFVSGLIVGSIQALDARLRSARMQAVARASLALTTAVFLFRLLLGVLKDFDPPVPHWRSLTDLENNGPIRLVNFGLFALGTVWVWQRIPERLKVSALSRWLAHLGQHALQVFAWSVAATYVSLAMMPSSPSRAWSAMDMTLTVLSLVVPAHLHGLFRRRTKAAGSC